MRVVVTGASGLVGSAAVDAFAAAGWEVVAVSRRPPRPAPSSADRVRHLPVDLRDTRACLSAFGSVGPVTHLAYAAVHERPGLIEGWQDADQMNTNRDMLRNVLEPLSDAGTLQHVSLLQGTKAYGAHLHPIRVPSRESQPRDPHENFYWLQEDLTRDLAARRGFGWTILRPPLVIGPTHGVAMNLVPVLGAWAALRRHAGLPFSYPGGPSYVADAVDVRVLADAMVWAATSPAARDQHFNVTNGDVFTWRDVWDAMADALGVETGPDQPQAIVPWLEARQSTWQEIVRANDLVPTTLASVLGESHHYADWQFAHQARRPPQPKLLSTVKIRRAGFTPVLDTETSLVHWLEQLRARRLLPATR